MLSLGSTVQLAILILKRGEKVLQKIKGAPACEPSVIIEYR